MSKTLPAGIGLALLLAFLSDPAQASTLRTRFDPNDHEARTDIRRVRSDLTASRLFLEVASWQRAPARFIAYATWLDTRGTWKFDREVRISRSSGHLMCVVSYATTGRTIGMRSARRSNQRVVACELPRTWFGRIHRAVRFHILDMSQDYPDRAPNRREYRWL
jgi:hypothetical protein